MSTCIETGIGQDSEEGCEEGYESGKQSKVGKRILMIGLEKFGWRGLDTKSLSRLSISKVKQVLIEGYCTEES